MTDTILDALTATRDLVQMEHGPGAPATKVLDEAIKERGVEVTTIRLVLEEALDGLTECLGKYGCSAPVSVTKGITSVVQLQRVFRR